MRSVGAQLSPRGSEGYSTLTVLSHASGITRKDFSVLSAALSAHLLGRKNLKYPFCVIIFALRVTSLMKPSCNSNSARAIDHKFCNIQIPVSLKFSRYSLTLKPS